METYLKIHFFRIINRTFFNLKNFFTQKYPQIPVPLSLELSELSFDTKIAKNGNNFKKFIFSYRKTDQKNPKNFFCTNSPQIPLNTRKICQEQNKKRISTFPNRKLEIWTCTDKQTNHSTIYSRINQKNFLATDTVVVGFSLARMFASTKWTWTTRSMCFTRWKWFASTDRNSLIWRWIFLISQKLLF